MLSYAVKYKVKVRIEIVSFCSSKWDCGIALLTDITKNESTRKLSEILSVEITKYCHIERNEASGFVCIKICIEFFNVSNRAK